MRVIRSIQDLDIPKGGLSGFVPTMGALHAGHESLLRSAKELCGFSVLSIFVNPTQFGPNEDYANYPRREAQDLDVAAAVGVDVVFIPSVAEIYSNSVTNVHVAKVTDLWEGAARPGHFDGVATVVCKLLNIVRPTHAFFGWKDFQQCVVIRSMVRDLNMPVELCFMETVREPDGLALSSRNAYLSPSERSAAPLLYRALQECRSQLLAGTEAGTCLDLARSFLSDQSFATEYIACVDNSTLLPSASIDGSSRLICAAKLGKTRLIDNIQV